MERSLDVTVREKFYVGDDGHEWTLVAVSLDARSVVLRNATGRTLTVGARQKPIAPGVLVRAAASCGRVRLCFEMADHVPVHTRRAHDWIEELRGSI